MKRKEFMLGAIAGLTVAAAATAGGVIDWPGAHAEPIAGATGRLAPTAGAAGLAFAPPQGAPLSFADIFQQVAPAVVQIDVKAKVERPRGGGMIQIPGLPFAIPNPNGGQQGEEGEDDEGATALGAGSGFFISADGFIVTNNHVVADAVEINVVLADGRELEAKVIGRDEATDLAVIKVEGSEFPFVTFEEAAQPRVGDWVIAVGNPFGLGGTATAGIVSALGRSAAQFDRNDAGYVDFLQIDAAINRGNSGGPTFDIYGRVIGVNSAIISPTGSSAGIGFAIPASVAKSVTDQLMQSGAVQRGYVGLGLRTFDADRWEALGQPRDFKGAYIETVTPGGPSDRAGVEVGDILISVNGARIANGTEATRAVGAARPNEDIRLEVIRDGRNRTITVRSGTRPSETDLRSETGDGVMPGAPNAVTPQGEPVEGITASAITPAIRERQSIPESVNGLLITDVARGSAAADAGFAAGMVITQANSRQIRSLDDLRGAIRDAKAAGRPSILLFVAQGGQRGSLVLRFAAE
ncbi:trypsin-like peptidase domain-containing protein [Brevundimonas sp. NPDC092305]|uniref:trypsin-like peptidase domain-containing protein n=1 Tax=Brevundimonas sp. NPDC092305 TaxID=3363957 RepID=UPI0037FA7AEF